MLVLLHNSIPVSYPQNIRFRHVSCKSGHLDVVRFLITQPGVNVNARDRKKNTPLTGLMKYMYFHTHHWSLKV